MIIETTAHVTRHTVTLLKEASRKTGKRESELIGLVMKKTMQGHKLFSGDPGRIQYQKERPAHEWKRLHLTLISREYEFFVDMRKFFKRSVSFLIVFSVDVYLDQIVNELINPQDNSEVPDNYQFNHYILIKESLKTAICWRIYWGLPETLEFSIPILESPI